MNDLVKMNNNQMMVNAEPMTMDSLISRTMLVQQAMKVVMKDGHHYGKIPGCGDKPALFKSGAEKLAFLFRLAPKFDCQVTEMGNGHREYRFTCTMMSPNGQMLGEGVGSATTMESKWRYRWDATSKPVPSAYWESRDPALLGGSSFATRKIQGKWYIYQKAEHSDPADYYNTCLKMAKKRAQVDATLTVTGASDLFEQDIEELAVLQEEARELEEKSNPQTQKESKLEQAFKPVNPKQYGATKEAVQSAETEYKPSGKLQAGEMSLVALLSNAKPVDCSLAQAENFLKNGDLRCNIPVNELDEKNPPLAKQIRSNVSNFIGAVLDFCNQAK